MDQLQLLIDLHKGATRQGPGGEAETAKAIGLAGLDQGAPLKIADIGCGTGASTLMLARLSGVKVTAVDFIEEFLRVLEVRAQREGVAGKITSLCTSMDALPFAEEEFDVIWSEGAIYNIGFKKGVADWRHYLKPGGLLVVSEITWITQSRPVAIQSHWEGEYPEVDTASAKLKVLERQGYSPLGYFVLPESCWVDNYYRPLQQSFQDFLSRHQGGEEARALIEAEAREIELYQNYKDYYSYGVYIARKVA